MTTIPPSIVHPFVACQQLKDSQQNNAIVLLPLQHRNASALWCALYTAFSEPHSDILFVVRDMRQLHQTEVLLKEVVIPKFKEKHETSIEKCGNLFQTHEEAARILTYRLTNTSRIHFCVMNISAARHFTQHKPQCVILDHALQGIAPTAVTEFMHLITAEGTPVVHFLSAPL